MISNNFSLNEMGVIKQDTGGERIIINEKIQLKVKYKNRHKRPFCKGYGCDKSNLES